MSDMWHYTRGCGQTAGPVAEAALREMASRGELAPGDLVWRAGMTNWEPAGRFTELFPPGTVPPPLPPLPMSYVTPAPPAPMGESAGMRMMLPVGRSGWAIAAGYLGLFSVLLLPAPLAIFCALMAIREMRRNPRLHGMGRAIFGLVMGVGAVLGFIVMMFAAAW